MSATQLIKLIRRLDKYEEWKRAVFIRDRFACQQCGRRNGRKRIIEAHHLVELSTLVKAHRLTSVEEAGTCAGLWDISNGQTLCHGCHEQTDSYPKQFVKSSIKKKRNNGKNTCK